MWPIYFLGHNVARPDNRLTIPFPLSNLKAWSTLRNPIIETAGSFIRKELECVGTSLFPCSVGRKYGFWPSSWLLASRLAQLQKDGDLRRTGRALT
jgi:hypothetical protein